MPDYSKSRRYILRVRQNKIMNQFAGPLLFNGFLAIFLLFYYFKNKKNAIKAVKIALKSIKELAPIFVVFVFVIILLHGIFSAEIVKKYIIENQNAGGYFVAATLGGIVHVPPFIAFPIGGELLQSGIAPGIIAVFITSLVMVHTFTIPIEIKILGFKFAIVRNALGFIFSIIIGILIGALY